MKLKRNKDLKNINLEVEEEEKDINIGEFLSENEKNNTEFFANQNNENNKEELKKLFLEEIFYQKNTAANYEIPYEYFKEISMPPLGNCFYCCISYFLYKNIDNQNLIRQTVYQYISNNPEQFYIFFEGNDNENLNFYSPKTLLDNYISKYNRDGEYAGDLEYAAICKIYNIRIILLTKGYKGLNVYNIYF